jgi:arsenite methyltransferase
MNSEPVTANTLGYQLSHAAQLDGHFFLCQNEYEAMVRAVGIQTNWHVLDAGCGVGSFLPLLADLVGHEGRVTAIDIDSDNIQQSKQLVQRFQLEHSIRVVEGKVTSLLFEDNTFDAVWCANVTQYLADDEFAAALNEMIRVVKPGGLIAVKEFDMTAWQYQPSDPYLMFRLWAAHRTLGSGLTNGTLRPHQFRTWFQNAGLTDIRLKSFVSETQAPLRPADKRYIQNLLVWLAKNAETAEISEDDRQAWQDMADLNAVDHILNRPDFYAKESHILAVGMKPGSR